ncbi:M81 family metallopeptidase [Paenibacillus sp. FSL H8-0548]|uniref:M81 family metallopeptidase n=1 Tax=Paenibacillus sp. FSL H8-0548 TaxID=1920422 RepID=UPI00211621AC|nr:M81 family metallopeptidase [Paenibacillus sp. FSL H8-0548]
MKKLKIAVAGIFHETNTFAPELTRVNDFISEWTSGLQAFNSRYAGTRTSMGGIIEAALIHDTLLLPGVYTAATPSGLVQAATAETLLQSLVESVDTEADGLVLIMHGAMVSEQYADFEGECLRRLRQRLGKNLPIAMTLDLHANISKEMVAYSNLIVGYDTYPHIDAFERSFEAFELLVRRIRGEIHPIQSYVHTGMLVVPQGMMTESGKMQELMELAFKLEQHDSILNITIAGGFPYSDVPDAGMAFVVTANEVHQEADRCIFILKEWAIANKEAFNQSYSRPADAVIAAWQEPEGPVILAEGSDNVGGGAPADGTHTLLQLINPPQKALVVICDPEAVHTIFLKGVGQTLSIHVGGKTDSLHGDPVLVFGKVRLLSDGHYRHIGSYMTGQLADMGRTAVLECGLLTLILTEKRTAPWDLGHIRSVGLWPEDYKVIVAKSAIAWQAAFGPYAKAVIHIDSPGCCSANLGHFDYHHVSRPVYPLDAEPMPRYFSNHNR